MKSVLQELTVAEAYFLVDQEMRIESCGGNAGFFDLKKNTDCCKKNPRFPLSWVAVDLENKVEENIVSFCDKQWYTFVFPLKNGKRMCFISNKTNSRFPREEEAEHQFLKNEAHLEAFLAAVCHDIRSPLFSIRGFASLLNEIPTEDFLEKGQDFINRIIAASLRIEKTVADLLDYFQVNSTEIDHQVIDLNFLARNIINSININHNNKIKLTTNGDLHIYADKALMERVLANLLDNARIYHDENTPILIELGSVPSEKEKVFYLKDNGKGFDMKNAMNIFQPFEKLHGKKYKGSGIGLASVAKIINAHSGKVWCESQKDKGSTFYFSLPLES